ncbi:MAG: hypothetical protein DI640_14335 [Sphingomonas taxi]|uniref:Peptidase C39 domain-containing protein n=1 Tax=Sphingomonas taxi TaxID=1549858 RepID=A0A2W5AU35_9SPHN|nr:MAG: hypothetical protein DI640_14335 [Sphingomonas taxi]
MSGGAQERFAGHSESGLAAFAVVLAMHRIAVDPDQLRHDLGHERPVTSADLLRLAKRLDGVRARAVSTNFTKLKRLPMPVVASGPSGWFVIGRVGDDELLIQQPGHGVERLDRAALAERWSGEVVLGIVDKG